MSLLVLTAVAVTVWDWTIVGLLLLVKATVTLVLGDPMLEMLVLIPFCWEIRNASPIPKPEI